MMHFDECGDALSDLNDWPVPRKLPFLTYIRIVLHRFGRLFALGTVKTEEGTVWMCLCDCGNWTTAKSYDLSSGRKQSCGCLRVVASKARDKGHTKHPFYRHWLDAKTRCYNARHPSYKNHGAKGVTMYEAWRNGFDTFCKDVLAEAGDKPSSRHTLDRKNPFGNYEPGNIAWLTKEEQNANKRNSRGVEFHGEKMVSAQFAKRLQIHPEEVSRMLERGMTPEKIYALVKREEPTTDYVEV